MNIDEKWEMFEDKYEIIKQELLKMKLDENQDELLTKDFILALHKDILKNIKIYGSTTNSINGRLTYKEKLYVYQVIVNITHVSHFIINNKLYNIPEIEHSYLPLDKKPEQEVPDSVVDKLIDFAVNNMVDVLKRLNQSKSTINQFKRCSQPSTFVTDYFYLSSLFEGFYDASTGLRINQENLNKNFLEISVDPAFYDKFKHIDDIKNFKYVLMINDERLQLVYEPLYDFFHIDLRSGIATIDQNRCLSTAWKARKNDDDDDDDFY